MKISKLLKITLALLLLIPAIIFLLVNFGKGQNHYEMKTARLVADKKVFSSYEKPQFKIVFGQNTTVSLIGSVFAQEEPAVTAKFTRENDTKTILKADVTKQADQSYLITFDPANGFAPGKYTLSASISGNGTTRNFTQDFVWGVLALNPNKVTYSPGETSKISIGVLDENGGVICDANVALIITAPDGTKTTKTTADGSIKTTKQCHSKEASIAPDYATEVKLSGEGTYGLDLTAVTKNGAYQIQDYVKVSKSIDFDIERQSATRLYPKNQYPMTINITANRDYKGAVTETVPDSFSIIKTKQDKQTTDYAAKIIEKGSYKLLQWQVDWKRGEKHTLSYVYQGPTISPQFYLIGNLQLVNSQSSIVYSEGRFWELANDDTVVVITSSSNPLSC